MEYAGALAQAVFRALAAAADDMAALASAAAPELSALLVVWALQARAPAPGAAAAGRAGSSWAAVALDTAAPHARAAYPRCRTFPRDPGMARRDDLRALGLQGRAARAHAREHGPTGRAAPQETERFALLLKRHALAPFAAPAGLAATAACCLLALVHCRALEASHGLTLAPRLMRDLWPACEQARSGSLLIASARECSARPALGAG